MRERAQTKMRPGEGRIAIDAGDSPRLIVAEHAEQGQYMLE